MDDLGGKTHYFRKHPHPLLTFRFVYFIYTKKIEADVAGCDRRLTGQAFHAEPNGNLQNHCLEDHARTDVSG